MHVYEIFVGKTITVDGLASKSVTFSEVSSNEHAPGYHAVEGRALVVEWLPVYSDSLLPGAESPKVLCSFRGTVGKQLDHKSARWFAADGEV